MNLLPLSDDFVFKAVFARNPDLLLDLLNSFPEFSDEKKIKEIKVLNPEIPMNLKDDKLSILDIQAEDISGSKFLIEMQGSRKTNFKKRILYYWSNAYSKAIKKGLDYDRLPRIYSFNFTTFQLFSNLPRFHSVFKVIEKDNPKIRLTEDLEIHIIELPKLVKSIQELQSNLEEWVYLLKEAENLKEGEMKVLEKKNPKIKKVISELKTVSRDRKNRSFFDERLKADLDKNSGIRSAFRKGKEEGEQIGIQKGEQIGIQKGELNALYMGIQMALETKFNSKGLTLLPKIKKIKDVSRLQSILKSILKAKDLENIKTNSKRKRKDNQI